MNANVPRTTKEYLGRRLDGARDLYLLALALGERHEGPGTFGPMIQEARIHFVGVIEEAHFAGLDTSAISEMLKKFRDFADSVRPEVWERLEEIMEARPRKYVAPERPENPGGGKVDVGPQTIV